MLELIYSNLNSEVTACRCATEITDKALGMHTNHSLYLSFNTIRVERGRSVDLLCLIEM